MERYRNYGKMLVGKIYKKVNIERTLKCNTYSQKV